MLTLLLLAAPALSADLLVGPGEPHTTLSSAVAAAADGDRVLVRPGVYTEPEMVVSGRALTIASTDGPGTVTIHTSHRRGAFRVEGGAHLELQELDFDGEGQGRLAEVHTATLVVESCTVRNTSTPNPGQPGGSLLANQSTVTIRASTLEAAVAPVKNGGHIRAVGSVIALHDSTVSQGDGNQGGAISAVSGSVVTAADTRFEGNVADAGSVLHATDSDVQLTSCTVKDNVATTSTVHCVGGSLCAVDGTWFEGNLASSGALLTADGPTASRITDSVLCATSTGASAVDLRGTSATVRGSVFYDNALDGPLVRIGATASAEVLQNHFVAGITAVGAPALQIDGTATLVNNLVAHNQGPGASVTASGTVTERHNLWFDNVASHADFTPDPTDLVDVDPQIGPLTPGSCDVMPLIPPPTSPAIDAGDPSIVDADGTPSDIGAFTGLYRIPPGWEIDEDGDGVPASEDCNDQNPNVYPGNVEVACNDIDDDCDPSTPDRVDADGDGVSICDGDCDDNDPNRSEIVYVYFDGDRDGYGVGELHEVCGRPLNSAPVDGDCDDTDPSVHPGAEEIPYDGIDQDCDGFDADDLDGDGYPLAEDCDDNDPDIHPGAEEIFDDGIDQDCSGADATVQVIGGAGWTCGCASSGGAPLSGVWLSVLALWSTRRRRLRP